MSSLAQQILSLQPEERAYFKTFQPKIDEATVAAIYQQQATGVTLKQVAKALAAHGVVFKDEARLSDHLRKAADHYGIQRPRRERKEKVAVAA